MISIELRVTALAIHDLLSIGNALGRGFFFGRIPTSLDEMATVLLVLRCPRDEDIQFPLARHPRAAEGQLNGIALVGQRLGSFLMSGFR